MRKVLKATTKGVFSIAAMILLLISIGFHIYLMIAANLYFLSRFGIIVTLFLFFPSGPAAPLFPLVYWIVEGVFPIGYFVIVGIEIIGFLLVGVFAGISEMIAGKKE